MVGASLVEVMVTVVELSVTVGAKASSTVSINRVVAEIGTGMWFGVGTKTMPRNAVVMFVGVSLITKYPFVTSVKPPRFVSDWLSR